MFKKLNELDGSFLKVSKFNVVLTVILNIIFRVLGSWDYTVLLGSMVGLGITTFFYYSICVSVPKALGYGDPELAQKSIRASRSMRTVVMAVGLIVAIKLPWFNIWATIVPLLFTRISIGFIHIDTEGEEENK